MREDGEDVVRRRTTQRKTP